MSIIANQNVQNDVSEIGLFDKEALAASVFGKFSTQNRELISMKDIIDVVETLDLSDYLPVSKAPQLQVRRLTFTGAKRLNGHEEPIPINYTQTFTSGVNVVLIERNEVGKSSIWKTIKFALTGDDSDYDVDVRSWITNIWLTFSLNDHPYTVIMSRTEGALRAVLVPGGVHLPLVEAADTISIIFDALGTENVKEELQHFFFSRLGLTQLSWTQQMPDEIREVAERKASWLTYFQALLIPDGGDQYLLCDTQHSYGNQAGLILSAFLGLSFADPLNKLGVEESRTNKAKKHEEQLSGEEQQQAEEKIKILEAHLDSARNRLDTIRANQYTRRKALENAELNRNLIDMQNMAQEKRVELESLRMSLEQIGTHIQQERGRERRLREAIILQLHFTGIPVTLCPNCDTMIDEEAVIHERENHACRLCGKPAQAAPEEELVVKEAEAKECEKRCREAERVREAMKNKISRLDDELKSLSFSIEQTQQAACTGVSFALPTSEEEAECDQLLRAIGALQGNLTITQVKATGRQPEIDRLEIHQRIVKKVREVLRSEASHRNEIKLSKLEEFTRDTAQRIGAESVTNVSCSPLGIVKIRKHDQPVAFTQIKNEGERLRIKLAFFLAMMRLSRENGGGRHPGFLIIDQPGSNEMVASDFSELAQVFRQIDQDFGEKIQVLCFTARAEFRKATDDSHIYGAQVGHFAF